MVPPERAQVALAFTDIRGIQIQAVHEMHISIMSTASNFVGKGYQFRGVGVFQQVHRRIGLNPTRAGQRLAHFLEACAHPVRSFELVRVLP